MKIDKYVLGYIFCVIVFALPLILFKPYNNNETYAFQALKEQYIMYLSIFLPLSLVFITNGKFLGNTVKDKGLFFILIVPILLFQALLLFLIIFTAFAQKDLHENALVDHCLINFDGKIPDEECGDFLGTISRLINYGLGFLFLYYLFYSIVVYYYKTIRKETYLGIVKYCISIIVVILSYLYIIYPLVDKYIIYSN